MGKRNRADTARHANLAKALLKKKKKIDDENTEENVSTLNHRQKQLLDSDEKFSGVWLDDVDV
jgi:hypothetical protein